MKKGSLFVGMLLILLIGFNCGPEGSPGKVNCDGVSCPTGQRCEEGVCVLVTEASRFDYKAFLRSATQNPPHPLIQEMATHLQRTLSEKELQSFLELDWEKTSPEALYSNPYLLKAAFALRDFRERVTGDSAFQSNLQQTSQPLQIGQLGVLKQAQTVPDWEDMVTAVVVAIGIVATGKAILTIGRACAAGGKYGGPKVCAAAALVALLVLLERANAADKIKCLNQPNRTACGKPDASASWQCCVASDCINGVCQKRQEQVLQETPMVPDAGHTPDTPTPADNSTNCVPPFAVCDGICVNTQSVNKHCGACGNDCGNALCIQGQCQSPPDNKPKETGQQDVCGDGVITGNEACDGFNTNGVTCKDLGFDGGDLMCDPKTCQRVLSSCHRCNDGKRHQTEECDKSDLNRQTCRTLGFDAGGTLSCDPSCQFDTTKCTYRPARLQLAINKGAADVDSQTLSFDIAASHAGGITAYFLSAKQQTAPAANSKGWVPVPNSPKSLQKTVQETAAYCTLMNSYQWHYRLWIKDSTGTVSKEAPAVVNYWHTNPMTFSGARKRVTNPNGNCPTCWRMETIYHGVSHAVPVGGLKVACSFIEVAGASPDKSAFYVGGGDVPKGYGLKVRFLDANKKLIASPSSTISVIYDEGVNHCKRVRYVALLLSGPNSLVCP